MTRGRPRTRLRIVDARRLADLVTTVIEKEFGGNVSVAARKTGLERSLLNRIRRGRLKGLSVRDVTALRRALSVEQFAVVQRCLVDETLAGLLAAFDQWLGDERSRLLHRTNAPPTVLGDAVASQMDWGLYRVLEYGELLDVVRRRHPGLFEDFDAFLQTRKHFRIRAELAYARILAPLLDSVESGWVERRWQELSALELRRFLKAGMDRERILLDRPPDVQRAELILGLDVLELLGRFPELFDERAFTGHSTHPLFKHWLVRRRDPKSSQRDREANSAR